MHLTGVHRAVSRWEPPTAQDIVSHGSNSSVRLRAEDVIVDEARVDLTRCGSTCMLGCFVSAVWSCHASHICLSLPNTLHNAVLEVHHKAAEHGLARCCSALRSQAETQCLKLALK